jgi:hypothetical protein
MGFRFELPKYLKDWAKRRTRSSEDQALVGQALEMRLLANVTFCRRARF